MKGLHFINCSKSWQLLRFSSLSDTIGKGSAESKTGKIANDLSFRKRVASCQNMYIFLGKFLHELMHELSWTLAKKWRPWSNLSYLVPFVRDCASCELSFLGGSAEALLSFLIRLLEDLSRESKTEVIALFWGIFHTPSPHSFHFLSLSLLNFCGGMQ